MQVIDLARKCCRELNSVRVFVVLKVAFDGEVRYVDSMSVCWGFMSWQHVRSFGFIVGSCGYFRAGFTGMELYVYNYIPYIYIYIYIHRIYLYTPIYAYIRRIYILYTL